MKIAHIQVDYVDHMGTDLTVVNSARVSFDKASEWEYVAQEWEFPTDAHISERDSGLIAYLAKNNHWSPFAHTSIQLRIKAPIFVARQLVKHQVGGVWNEVSRRYVDSEPEFWFPKVWRGRPEGGMKQGSTGEVDDQAGWSGEFKHYTELCAELYERAVSAGVAPEQARMILPQNMMTEWYWTGSLMFFARVCKLRLDSHAQSETRDVAERIAEVVEPLFPVSWAALMGGADE